VLTGPSEYAFYFANSFNDILMKIKMPSLATGVGAFLQISIKADGKGDLKYDFVVLKSGGFKTHPLP
jgi:hypothetical protein